ncbi:MAG: hypothetical protein HUU50_19580 [Candidatus Brocadiae bacterium]|nr:hypothetical protein [Candidatus Brocadiia bacterium]
MIFYKQKKLFSFFLFFALFCGFYREICAEEYISIQPSDLVVQPEAKVPFMVGLVRNGNVDPSALPWDFQYSSSEGSFSGNVYTAPKTPGTYLVFVKYKELFQIAMITVEAQEAIASISISPEKATISPGEEIRFQAKVYGKSGKLLEFSPAWGAKGGKIESKGNFKAGNQPGEFNVVAWGPGGIKATAIVKIQGKEIPQDILIKLEIEPASPKIFTKESIFFKAYAIDQKGQNKNVPIAWTASSGIIDQQGKFTAQNTPGKVKISARHAALEASIEIDVLAIPLALTTLTIADHAPRIPVGQSIVFQAKGKDQFEKDMGIPIQWESSGGSIQADGKFLAEKEGKYQIWAKSGKLSARTEIEVIAAPSVVAKISILPESSEIYVGQSIQLNAQVWDQNNKLLAEKIEWGCLEAKIENGKFRAEKEGKYQIWARSGKVLAYAYIQVIPEEPIAKKIVITPLEAKVKVQQSIQFQAQVLDQRDNPIIAKVDWSASGGKIDEKGIFTAGNIPLEGKIIARTQEVSQSISVQIEALPPAISKLYIVPDSAKIKSTESLIFELRGEDVSGNRLEVKADWEASGGTIDSQGKFTAGKETGLFSISAKEKNQGLSAKANVTIIPQIEYQIKVRPESSTVDPGTKIRYEISLYREGKEQWAWPWEFTFLPSQGTFSDMVYTAPLEPGTYQIKIQHPKGTAVAVVTVKAVAALPKIERILVEPVSVRLEYEETFIPKAVALDEKGNVAQGTFQWEAQGGMLNKEGIFKAGEIPGTYKIKVTEISSGKSQEITVVIAAPKERYILQVNPSPLVMMPGSKQKLDIKLLQGDKHIWTWDWEYTIVPSGGLVENGIYKAPLEPGKYTIEIRHAQAFAKIQVEVKAQEIVKLSISPKEATIKPGEEQTFFAQGFDIEGNLIPVKVQWQATGGKISQDGVYTALDQTGIYEIEAKSPQGLTAKASVKVHTMLQKIVVFPNSVVLSSGQKFQFQAKGYLENGQESNVEVKWFSTGGEIDENGILTVAEKEGDQFIVRALHSSGMEGVASLTIQSMRAQSLEISPEKAEIYPGDKQKFNVRGIVRGEMEADLNLKWFASGGTIDENGLYTAGQIPGTYDITAIDTLSQIIVRARVQIKPSKQLEKSKGYELFVHPGNMRVNQGANILLKPSLSYQGRQVWCWPWEFRYICSGGVMVGEYGNIWIAPITPGRYTITISHREAVSILEMVVEGAKAQNKVSRIVIAPQEAFLNSGQICSFSVKAYDMNDDSVDANVQWNATGGSIDANGNYLAGNAPGIYQVWAYLDSNKDIRANAIVTIKKQPSLYNDGFSWGIALAQGRVKREQILQAMEEIFYKPVSSIYEFQQGFSAGYGKDGVAVIKNIWSQTIHDLGAYYGENLKLHKISQAKVMDFMRSYIKRLGTTERNVFKMGFLKGYERHEGIILYRRLEDAFK